MSTPNEPAFPGIEASLDAYAGVTQRQYAAIHIMAGMMGIPVASKPEFTAQAALDYADALLKLESETRK